MEKTRQPIRKLIEFYAKLAAAHEFIMVLLDNRGNTGFVARCRRTRNEAV